jgi:hypothetical protein
MKKIQKIKQSLVWWFRSVGDSRRRRRAAYYEALRWQAAFNIPLSGWQVFRLFYWPELRGLGLMFFLGFSPVWGSWVLSRFFGW